METGSVMYDHRHSEVEFLHYVVKLICNLKQQYDHNYLS